MTGSQSRIIGFLVVMAIGTSAIGFGLWFTSVVL